MGGGGQFLDLMGGTAVMRGDIELIGKTSTRENPAPCVFISNCNFCFFLFNVQRNCLIKVTGIRSMAPVQNRGPLKDMII